jgi:alpha-L-rhamnosidase
LVPKLSDNGQADVAYTLAAQETYPSWGWWIANGATTLYENWDIDAKHDISMNHIMFGAVGGWLYQGLGGIKPDPQQPGFKNVVLEPNFVKGLDQFSASHDGPYGTIRSGWKRSGTSIAYNVTIPPNSTATLMLANGQKAHENGKALPAQQNQYVLQAGTYQLEIR